MGAFKIEIIGVGGHGCERKAKAGDKLHGRCGRFNCPDCMAYEFTQQLRQKGMLSEGGAANSATIVGSAAADLLDRIKAKGLYPESPEFEEGRATAYVRIQDSEILPDRAESVWLVIHKNGSTELQASYQMRAEFTHWPDSPTQVVDDMLKNERKAGQF